MARIWACPSAEKRNVSRLLPDKKIKGSIAYLLVLLISSIATGASADVGLLVTLW